MKFGEVKKGDSIYLLEVKDSEIIDKEIKKKLVSEVCINDSINSIEIKFSDGSVIIPNKDDDYVVRGLSSIVELLEPFVFRVYATTYECCYETIKKIVESKIKLIEEESKKMDWQMEKLYYMDTVVGSMNVKELVVLEPVFAD